VSQLHDQLAAAAASHRGAISVLAQFVDKTHNLLLQQPHLRDPSEAAQFLRLSPALLSTLSPDKLTEYQKSIEQVIQQEHVRQERIKTITQEFPGLLMRMALIYRVALFDAFLSDVQLCVLTVRPELLRDRERHLTYTEIVEAMTQGRLIDVMAESTVTSIDRHSIKDQLKKMGKRLQTEFKVEEEVQNRITEVIARRNIFTHANGIVDSAYLKLVPDSPHTIGTKLEVSYPYWMDGHQLLRQVCDQLLQSLFARHCAGVAAPTV
jgi:hypothetical protein